jgi:hypothetical protein
VNRSAAQTPSPSPAANNGEQSRGVRPPSGEDNHRPQSAILNHNRIHAQGNVLNQIGEYSPALNAPRDLSAAHDRGGNHGDELSLRRTPAGKIDGGRSFAAPSRYPGSSAVMGFGQGKGSRRPEHGPTMPAVTSPQRMQHESMAAADLSTAPR